MFFRLRNRFGTVGLIVSIVALVAALAGGAYAASGALTGKQKKEVKKIAQTQAKKFATAGPAGPPGPPGPAGAVGAAGKDGSPGTAGTNGKSVQLGTPTGAECSSGGVTVQVEGTPASKKPVCNGQTGFTETLPSGKSLKGMWSGSGKGEEFPVLSPISFGIPLGTVPTFVYVKSDGISGVKIGASGVESLPTEAEIADFCPGNAAEPKAKAGFLCAYAQTESSMEMKLGGFIAGQGNPTKFGAAVPLQVENGVEEGFARGTWAVTAP
jgi:hypothetical protein